MMHLRKNVMSVCFLLLIGAAAENFLAPQPANTVSLAASQEDNKLPAHAPCTSPYGCFQVNLEASDFMQLSTAKDLPKGIENFGVEATYDSAQYAQSLFAAIQAPSRSPSRSRALFVNVTDPRTPAPESVFCVFDLGAFPVDPDSGRGGSPYLKIAQQHGVECQFKFLKATKPVGIEQSATFVYSLTTLYNTSEACGSESLPVKDASICPSPPQPALPPPSLVLAEEVVEAPRKEEEQYSYKCEDRRCVIEHNPVDVRRGFFAKKGDCEKSCPGAKKEMLDEVQEEEEQKINSCESTTGCFEVRLALETSDMQLQDARNIRPGTNYGVAVKYSDSNQVVFATIQDSDGDHLVNVTTGSAAFCVFDLGAQETPYLELVQQLGVNCNFALTETRRPGRSSSSSAPTFVYSLSADYDASVACGSASLHPKKPRCPEPPQPKVSEDATELSTVLQI